jgi:hypothetical protein
MTTTMIQGSQDLPPADVIWAWQERLNGLGPRLTGNDAHRKSIDFLESELEALGLRVTRDRLRFRRWEALSWDIGIETGSDSWKTIPVSYFFPYSGQTGPGGVEGPLVYYKRPPLSFSAAAGKIAVVEVSVPVLPRFLASIVFQARSHYPDDSVDFAGRFTMPLLVTACLPNLAAAAKAGVLGVICVWRKCSAANAAFQYIPFTWDLQGCPALWVSGQAGDELRALAKKKSRARLRLNATAEPDAETDSLYAILPGADPTETIIVNTHTDGPNACEENGSIALLAIAHSQARLDPAERRRTIIFVFATGHFQIPQLAANGQATSTWLEQHPELWDGKPGHKKAVAGVTIEHLGATEWKDDENWLTYAPTGKQELELVYTANSTLDSIYLQALSERTKTRTMTLKPMSELYFGEGQPLFQMGIPTISLIPTPDYLCAAGPNGYIEKLDPELFYEQIQTFAKVLSVLHGTPTNLLLVKERQPLAILRAILRFTGLAGMFGRKRGQR